MPVNPIDDYKRRIALKIEGIEVTLADAGAYMEKLRAQLDEAFEANDWPAAETLDARLEELYDKLEAALSDIEEDGPKLASAHEPEAAFLSRAINQISDLSDSESSLEADLAATYDEQVEHPVGLTMSWAALANNIRDSIQIYGGNPGALSDDELIDVARDAYENSGQQKALNRPPANPAFKNSLAQAEAILNQTTNKEDDQDLSLALADDEPDTGPRFG